MCRLTGRFSTGTFFRSGLWVLCFVDVTFVYLLKIASILESSPISGPHRRRAGSRAAGTCSTAASPPLSARSTSSPTGMEIALLLAGSIGPIFLPPTMTGDGPIRGRRRSSSASPPSPAARRNRYYLHLTSP